jgi:hypothetical protein
MKISEIHMTGIKTYQASVRVVVSGFGSARCRVNVQTDSPNSARLMLGRLYGKENVFSIKELVLDETAAGANPQPMTAQDQQVKSLMNKSSQLNQQAKKIKATQKLQKAQQDYTKANQLSGNAEP